MDDDADSDCNRTFVKVTPCDIAQNNRERHSLCRVFRYRLCPFVLFVRRLE